MKQQTESGKFRIMLVDDDADLLHLIGVRLKASGYDVLALENAEQAMSRVASFRPHLVVTDLRMPGMDGMALFEELQHHYLHLPVIVLTAHGTIPDAVEATQRGIFSFLVKPFDADVLLGSIEKALQHSTRHSNGASAPDDQRWREEIISCSAEMESLLEQTRAAAVSDVNILIQSETGTGKELLASAIHKASSRRHQAFMALNCAAIPENLIESELFGHEAGAFTGAGKRREGLFQAADGGTVFLDEIGDMPIAAQAKLLRVLEQREVRPVGSTATTPIDVRIVAATHQDLGARVSQGNFREDLYYRLNVLSLELPPLRDRREDILLLAEHFCHQLAKRNDKVVNGFAPGAVELLVSAPWPGNVRQLYNVVEQCVVLTSGPIISRKLIERSLKFKQDKLLSLNEARCQFERNYLVRLLNLTEGNIALASRLAERNRSEFYNLLRRHRLEPDQFRRSSSA